MPERSIPSNNGAYRNGEGAVVMAIVGAAVVPAIQVMAGHVPRCSLIHGFHAVLCLRWRLLLARKQVRGNTAEVTTASEDQP